MARSIWKGPFVDGYMLKKADAARTSGRGDVVKIWSRRSTILPQFVGITFGVYNGHKHIPVNVSEDMIGHKFGEFAPTRTFHGHSADKKAKATIRMLRVSPQKLNLLAQLIRGKKVSKALADLEFSHKRISVEVKKALESAIANAENNHELDVDDLVVAQAFVGKDTVMKRFSPRARGRAGRIEKPFSNITIVVREEQAAAA
jgi:large subunit ribosomal protein L22